MAGGQKGWRTDGWLIDGVARGRADRRADRWTDEKTGGMVVTSISSNIFEKLWRS